MMCTCTCTVLVRTGPGVASSFYYQISTEQVLLALEGSLEADELEHWKALLQKRVQMPRDAYVQWAKHCLSPFGAALSTTDWWWSPSATSSNETSTPLKWLDEDDEEEEEGMERQRADLKPEQVARHRLLLMSDRTAGGGQQFQVYFSYTV